MSVPHIALLRGVNVGGKRLAMADLRACADSLGWTGVRTLLNSGNLVFTAPPSPDLAVRLEAALKGSPGLDVRVTVLTAEQLRAVADANPLRAEAAEAPSRLLVSFPRTPELLDRLRPLAERDWSPERVVLTPVAAFTWHPDGVSAGELAEAVDRAGRDLVTARNWSTVGKLLADAEHARGLPPC